MLILREEEASSVTVTCGRDTAARSSRVITSRKYSIKRFANRFANRCQCLAAVLNNSFKSFLKSQIYLLQDLHLRRPTLHSQRLPRPVQQAKLVRESPSSRLRSLLSTPLRLRSRRRDRCAGSEEVSLSNLFRKKFHTYLKSYRRNIICSNTTFLYKERLSATSPTTGLELQGSRARPLYPPSPTPPSTLLRRPVLPLPL